MVDRLESSGERGSSQPNWFGDKEKLVIASGCVVASAIVLMTLRYNRQQELAEQELAQRLTAGRVIAGAYDCQVTNVLDTEQAPPLVPTDSQGVLWGRRTRVRITVERMPLPEGARAREQHPPDTIQHGPASIDTTALPPYNAAGLLVGGYADVTPSASGGETLTGELWPLTSYDDGTEVGIIQRQQMSVLTPGGDRQTVDEAVLCAGTVVFQNGKWVLAQSGS